VSPDRQVTHPRFGSGTVVSTRWKGLEVLLQLSNGIKVWVRSDELISHTDTISRATAGTTGPARPETQEGTGPIRDQDLQSRAMIEALRLGIVPHRYVENLTVGREREIDTFRRWLDGPRIDGAFIIEGQYGSGKTHLLEYLASLALKWNYAVAKTEFDLFEAPPHKPKRVYQRLLRSFLYPKEGKVGDFREFMRRIAEHAPRLLKDHVILGPFVDQLNSQENELLWDWIEGLPAPFQPRLYDHATAANIYCCLLSGLGTAASEALDLKGLLLLFDEAETATFASYPYQLERGIDFLVGLISVAQNDARLLREGIRLEVISPVQRLYRGIETRLTYSGFNQCRYLFRNPSGLRVVFALTPTESINAMRTKIGDRMMELEALPPGAMRELHTQVCAFYSRAYPEFRLPKEGLQATFQSVFSRTHGLRMFIKGSVEALDLLRHYPGRPLGDVLR